jgi:putative addiction module CopG family antidote
MNISLTPALEDYIRRKVATGLYNNASEVIREALRLLVQQERTPAVIRAEDTKEKLLAELTVLKKYLRQRGVASLALFGSSVRGDRRSDSDVDLLIDIDPNMRFSLVDLVGVKDFLEDRLGRSVDVVTREGLEPLIRDQVLREAEAVF